MFFFFNDTATTEIYTLSLHDALPISFAEHGQDQGRHRRHRLRRGSASGLAAAIREREAQSGIRRRPDRKSTRLNSSHVRISYAVFCLKKKKTQPYPPRCT